MDPKWLQGYTQCGHAYLELKDTESALQQYLKAIRIANLSGQEVSDPLLYQRAGAIYIENEKWEDARVMFLLCSDQYKTAFSYFNLGFACYKLGNYNEAE